MKPQNKPPTATHQFPVLKDLDALKEASRLSGSHFFSPDTMRGFGSKLAPDFYPLADSNGLAALFITSERDRYAGAAFGGAQAWNGQWRYTVCLASFSPSGLVMEGAGPFSLDGDGLKDNGFGAFGTLAAARVFAKKAATLGTPERAALHANETRRRKINGWPAPAFKGA